MTEQEIAERLQEILNENAVKGSGFFQRDGILRQFQDEYQAEITHEDQLRVLQRMSFLFREGILCEGLDLDNPKFPFMHVTPRGVAEGYVQVTT